MYLSRKQSKAFALLIVILFLLSGGLILWKQPTIMETETSGEEELPLAVQKLDPQPSPVSQLENSDVQLPVTPSETSQSSEAFSLQRFERSETVDGKVLWRVLGENARYIPEKNYIQMSNCDLTFHTNKDEKVQIRSEEAFITLLGAQIGSAQLNGNVVLDFEDSKVIMTSDEANYRQAEQDVTVEGPVSITSKWYEVTGTGLNAKLKEKEFRIESDVKSVIKPKNGYEK